MSDEREAFFGLASCKTLAIDADANVVPIVVTERIVAAYILSCTVKHLLQPCGPVGNDNGQLRSAAWSVSLCSLCREPVGIS